MHTKPQKFILNFLNYLFLLTAAVFQAAVPVHAEPLPVFVSIAPQKRLVEQLGGDLISTQVLLDKGQEPHTYQPGPDKMTALFHSRLYFTLGMPFEREIAKKIESNKAKTLQLIDITSGIKRIAIAAHHHEEGEHGKHGEQGHEETKHLDEHADPHVWIDPQNLEKMAAAMTEALAAADPEHAAVYQQNFSTLQKKLRLLHQEIKQQLAQFQGATFFVFHPAFGYFAHAYDLHQEAVEVEGKAPAPKQLYALVRHAKADNIKVIFVQPQFDQKNAQTVAQAIKGRLVVLDPLAEDVELNLRRMAEAIRSALSTR